jgi:hypothetical protein
MNLSRIEPNLFVGSCPHDADDVKLLRSKHGVTAVLNVQTDEDMEDCGINRSTTTVIAYLHRCQGWELADALGHVLRQRACDPLVQAIVAADWST